MGLSERQADVFNLLKELGQGNRDLSPLKELFWTELNYQRVNQPIPLRNWPDTAAAALAEKPLLFAAGGQDKAFHIIYTQFSSDRLKFGPERTIVSQLLREYPYALFVFSNSRKSEWHFVNVKIAKEQHSQENRDPKYRRFFRRISVLPGEGLRTAAERLSLIQLGEPETPPLQLQALHDTAFDKEKVTEAFYEDYVNALDTLDEAIHGFAQSETENRARRDYGQLLLGRLMFLYFIQMKGWLGREGQASVHEHVIQSDFEYLQRHYRQIRDRSARRNASGFYEDFLQGLFFKTLNTPRHDRAASITRKYGEIPFLNGGLFQRTREEKNRRITIPDEAFAPILDPEFMGDSGKQALFLNYNFTVREDDPLDVTVAVDPEMLGKAFERQVVGREIKGAFYTPGPVVDVMCRESLRYHFSEQTHVQTKKIDYILEQHDAGELTDKEAGLLFEAAQDVRICDPAVGSGAFLIGMLHRLVTLQEVIHNRFPALRQTIRKRIITGHTELPQVLADELDESTLRYFLKRYVTQHNLYGVDIERFAVQIAQLRLWLSLTVDLEAKYIAHIPPLPNLDLNLRVGNSLIATYQGIDFELETGAQAQHFVPVLAGLDSLRSQYYEETREDGKERLREAIEREHLRLLKAGVKEELNLVPLRPAAIEGALQERKARDLYPDMVSHTPDENREINYLVRRESELKAALKTLSNGNPRTDGHNLPLLWRIHFASIFGRRNPGFDIIIGNPPYVSTQGSSGIDYVDGLVQKIGFNDDFYVFFTSRAFGLPENHFPGIVREGGIVCLITSDTYFTLQTKERMRDLLQEKDLRWLVQIDPFKATVDTAIFLCINRGADKNSTVEFVQARYASSEELEYLWREVPWSQPSAFQLPLDDNQNGEFIDAVHCEVGKLRRHRVGSSIYRHALKKSFFEPSSRNAALYNRFMEPLTRLVEEWWEKIKDSRKFEQHRAEIEAYHETLRPGDVTLLGLICDGGQGMRTANNGRFLGYLEGTSHADAILRRQRELLKQWKDSPHISRHLSKLEKDGREFSEICDMLKLAFDWQNELRLRRGEIYRIVPKCDVVDVERMAEAEKTQGIIHDQKCWVPFRKGDPEGNKWISFDPLYIFWSRENVQWLFLNSGRSEPNMPVIRNAHLYFTEGITWTLLGNHVHLKARIQPKCVFDAGGSRLTPVASTVSANCFLALMNSQLVSYIIKKFLKNTAAYEIGDLRQVPIVMPTAQQEKLLASYAMQAIEIQTDILQNSKAERQQELDAIQIAVNEAVEDLYGVSELGPFNEF